jgi:hypothetical protein
MKIIAQIFINVAIKLQKRTQLFVFFSEFALTRYFVEFFRYKVQLGNHIMFGLRVNIKGVFKG